MAYHHRRFDEARGGRQRIDSADAPPVVKGIGFVFGALLLIAGIFTFYLAPDDADNNLARTPAVYRAN